LHETVPRVDTSREKCLQWPEIRLSSKKKNL
jgi:hypothetical protein